MKSTNWNFKTASASSNGVRGLDDIWGAYTTIRESSKGTIWKIQGCTTVDGRNPANQLLSSLSHYLRRVLYIPGGDRRISEPSKVPFFKPHLTISNFLAHHFLLKFGIGGGNQQWRRSSQNICQRLSSEIKALGILHIYFYTYNTLW